MSVKYIYTLAQRHAAIERRIADAMKAPSPDTLQVMHLKKLRLAYRDQIREAIHQKRTRASAARRWRWLTHPATRATSPVSAQPIQGQ